MNNEELPRTINLFSAIFIIIGYVVGASIFILPGELMSIAGPAVFLAYLLAAVPAIFYCFVIAQVGCAFPTSGGSYILIKKALSPYMGFVYLWFVLSLAAVAIPLITVGFARYLSLLITSINSQWIAIISIIIFITVNCLGKSVATSLQNTMVIMFLIALVVFSGGGLAHADMSLLEPLLPFEFKGVLIAAATAYFSYAGVLVVSEIAGEIKQPGRNIPIAIVVSFLIIIALYILIPLSLAVIMPWQAYAETQAPVIVAAKKFLSPVVVDFIWVGALFAAATSINSILMGLSRDLYKGAVDGVFPSILTKVHSIRKTPIVAVIAVGSLSIIGVLLGKNIIQYAQITVLGLMVTQILTSLAVLRMPKVLPEEFAQSEFQLSHKALTFFSITSLLFGLLFSGFIISQNPDMGWAFLIYLVMGSIYYYSREFYQRRMTL